MIGETQRGGIINQLTQIAPLSKDPVRPSGNPCFLATFGSSVRSEKKKKRIKSSGVGSTTYEVSKLSVPISYLYVGKKLMRASE